MRNVSVRVGVLGVIVGASLALGGCLPRGETKTLNEVVSIAQSRYAATSKEGLPVDVSSAITSIAENLSVLAAGDDVVAVQPKIVALGEAIAGLVEHAGFTSRPALSELATQYRVLGGASADQLSAPQLRLLASRTYSALAAELETTRFAL
jgi:hypothetical protein